MSEHAAVSNRASLLTQFFFSSLFSWLSIHYTRSPIQLSIQPHQLLSSAQGGNRKRPPALQKQTTGISSKQYSAHAVLFFQRLWHWHAVPYLPSPTSSFHACTVGADTPEDTGIFASTIYLPIRGGTTMHIHTLEMLQHESVQIASSWCFWEAEGSQHVWVCICTFLAGRGWGQVRIMLHYLENKQNNKTNSLL